MVTPARTRSLSIAAIISVLIGTVIYAQRIERPALYYFGASPELPHGRAFAVLNPFRDRRDERNAEALIRDLRTNQCEQIVTKKLHNNAAMICSTLQKDTRQRLIWKQDRGLIYELLDSRSRLQIIVANRTDSWSINGKDWSVEFVSILR